MSNSPYAQVALTYLRRPFSSLQVGIAVVIVLGFSIFGMYSVLRFDSIRNDGLRWTGTADLPHSLTVSLLAAAWLAGLVAMHVKDQFAESRSRLTPNFHRVHLVVAAAATLIFAVVAPSLVAWLAGLRSVGLVALITLLFGVVFWLVLMQSNWAIWLLALQILLSVSESMRSASALIVSGQLEAQAVGLLTLGAAIILLAGRHLARLNEDMPEYHRRMLTSWAAKGRMTGQNVNYDGPVPRKLMDWFREQAMARLTRHVRYAARSPWSRICRWQAGIPAGWPVWLWGLFAIGLLQFLNWYSPRPMANGMTSMMVANSFAFFPMLLGANQLASWLTLRSRRLEYELMLPVDRRSYVRQLGAALALGHFQLWGVICATIAVWWLVTVAAPPSLGYVGSLAAVTLLTQVWHFGVVVLTFTMTSLFIPRVAVLIVSTFGSIFLVMGGARMNNFQLLPEVMPIAGGLAALGVLLAYIAYRRWLVIDLD